jgi:hypothetical protein
VTVLENNSWYNVLAVSILRKQLEKQGQLICGLFIQILRRVDSCTSVKKARGTNEIGEHKGKYYHTAQFV